MITPREIQENCLKWWKDVLLSAVNATSYFPKTITRIGKIGTKDILEKLPAYQQSIALLINESKEKRKSGYRVILSTKQFGKIGQQKVPESVVIETLEDYLFILGRKQEYNLFLKNLELTQTELPLLKDWIATNPFWLIEHTTWTDTLKVCRYFLSTPKPGMYIRQLPIGIHTKYIYENKSIIQSLLEYLIPEHVNEQEKDFERRFNLLAKEQIVRVRFLDTIHSPLKGITDMCFTLKELRDFPLDEVKNIFVTENIMNFLTLPNLEDTIAIWSGGGFSVSYLKGIDWLYRKQFYYWGDLDAQGFQILNQFRTYFPNTIAVMMDDETLRSFSHGAGQKATNQSLPKLSEDELQLYHHLRLNNIRLEQEKISQAYADERIRLLFSESYNISSRTSKEVK